MLIKSKILLILGFLLLSCTSETTVSFELAPTPVPTLSPEESLQQIKTSKACINCNLAGLDLRSLSLFQAELPGANLKGANLEGARLERTNLEGANLEGANLDDTTLLRANLKNASLKGANLNRTDLRFADLRQANLKNSQNLLTAFLGGSQVGEAIWSDGGICLKEQIGETGHMCDKSHR